MSFLRYSIFILFSAFSISAFAVENYISTTPVELEFHVHSPSLLLRVQSPKNNLANIVNGIHTSFKRKINLKIQSDDRSIEVNEGYFYFSGKKILVNSSGIISVKTDNNDIVTLGKLEASKIKCVDNDNCTIGLKINAEVGFSVDHRVSRPYLYYFKVLQTYTTTVQMNYKGNVVKFFATGNGQQDYKEGHYSSKSMVISTNNF